MGFFAKMIFFVQLAYEETKILWLFKVSDIIHRDRAKTIQLAYECTEDKDNVDNHEHFNCSETVCLKCFGWKFWQTTNSTTTDLWDITGDAVEDINKNKKDCDKNCHPAGNALRWHKETRKEFDQLFLKKQGNWERIWLTFFFEKRRKLEKKINQLCWNPFSPQGSRRKLERIRSTSETIFHLIQDTMTNMPAGK